MPDDRAQAYLAKFGSAHPKNEQVLAWARTLFPLIDPSELSIRRGMFKAEYHNPRNPTRPVVRHLNRVGLMHKDKVLGIGTDAVEAVAAADVQAKQLAAKKAAEANPKPQEDMTPEAEKALDAHNQAIAELNTPINEQTLDKIAAVINTGVNLNRALGRTVQDHPLPENLPPVPTPEEVNKAKDERSPADPARITEELSK